MVLPDSAPTSAPRAPAGYIRPDTTATRGRCPPPLRPRPGPRRGTAKQKIGQTTEEGTLCTIHTYLCFVPISILWLNRKRIRNIEIPDREFLYSSPELPTYYAARPSTAPSGGRLRSKSARPSRQSRRQRSRSRARSPSHPNYKEEIYLKSRIRLKYVGHPDPTGMREVHLLVKTVVRKVTTASH